ncbi:MAG TPA: helix-turn-helix domain-containing protein [Polyangiaceae bacterium]|nr:helix-turn-helix domain-containing protein [Polyangiaceae bacterium]
MSRSEPAIGHRSLSPAAVEIVDESVLRRPAYDVHYDRGLVSAYYQLRQGYHIIRRRGSATSYLVYSVSGCGFFRDARDHLIRVGRGDLVLVEAHTYQEYGICPDATHWKCHWVHFDAQPHWLHWLPFPVRTGLQGVTSTHLESRSSQSQITDLFFRLHNEGKRTEAWSHALALNVLEQILIVARTSATDASVKPVDPRVSRVWQVIETCAPDPPGMAELSRVAGLSPSRLAFVFKQNTGISILAAVNRVRLRAAQHALQEPGTSVGEAAERAGFQSPYSFSNWYLKQTGMRPAEYRKRWIEMMRDASAEPRTSIEAARRVPEKPT